MVYDKYIHLGEDINKPHLFLCTGLDIPYIDYEKIYTPFSREMNITIVEITQEFITTLEEEVTELASYILSLNLKKVCFVGHSFSGVVIYKLAILLPDVYFYTILLDPSTVLSKPSIERNPSFSTLFKKKLIDLIDELPLDSKSIDNMETILITYINFQNITHSIKRINRIQKMRTNSNYTRFIEFYDKLTQLEQNRLSHFNNMYNNAHFILLPLNREDNLKKIFPHYIYSHRPTEIVEYIKQFFTPIFMISSKINGGGKAAITQRNSKNENVLQFPKRYIPSILHKADVKKAARELIKSRKAYKKGNYYTRKSIKRFPNKKSKHIIMAENLYGVKNIIPSKELAIQTGCSIHNLNKIVKKGMGAYFSSGSRPSQTGHSWGYARMASAISGGKAAAVDWHILKNCNKTGKAYQLAKKAVAKHGKGTRKVPKRQVKLS